MAKKKELLAIYLTNDKKEIKREFSPLYIPKTGDKVYFGRSETNLLEHESVLTYSVKKVVYIMPDVVSVFIEI